MYSNQLNFAMISKALSYSLEALKDEKSLSTSALKELQEAQKQFQQALSFSPLVKL